MGLTTTPIGSSGGGSSAWGAISGTMADQTDLQAALDLKANLNSPDFLSRVNVLGTGVTAGQLHLYDADSTHSVALVTSAILAANYALTLPAVTATIFTDAGGTMTGALTIGVGTLATTGLRLTQTWNAAATTCRAFEVAVTATAAAFAADSTIARFLGGASATTPIFSVLNTGTAWFDTASGHAIQMGVSNNLPRLVASFSGTNRSAILFNAAGSGVSPLLLSISGDCLFGRGAGLDNTPTFSTAFRGYAGSNTALTFTFSATNKDESGAYTGAGHNVELVGGRGSTQSTGAAGGGASLIGGAAAGSGNNNGGSVTITGGAPTGSGTRGVVNIAANAADTLGFYGVTPIARAVLATGAGATVDNVITALQNIGLVKQA